jgi:hypothetical protein
MAISATIKEDAGIVGVLVHLRSYVEENRETMIELPRKTIQNTSILVRLFAK